MNLKEIKRFKANILDLIKNEIYPADIQIENSYFKKVTPLSKDFSENSKLNFDGIIVPGFIDSHIHIESTLLTPSNFAKATVPYGTTSVIADSHEIANVCGIEGIEFMIKNGKEVPFDFYFSAPSCVPATNFENSGSVIDIEAIDDLMKRDEVLALGEVMNYVGVLDHDKYLIGKLNIAKKYKKPIDGHAPKLSGNLLETYIDEGISTDHESISFDEAIFKKKLGMKIMVREGSSAKNLEALFNMNSRIKLLSNQDFFGSISVNDFSDILKNPIFDFLVSDDKDPIDLKKGHLNILIKKAISLGIDPFEAIKMVTLNPAIHYNINSGLIAPEKIANFVLIDNLNDFNIKKTFVHGFLVAENGKTLFNTKKPELKNTFKVNKKIADDFDISYSNPKLNSNSILTNIIETIDNEIITNKTQVKLNIKDNIVVPDLENDILKLSVVERYGNNNISNAFIKGFNLKKGAIASSVSHDSHNIIAVGTNSEDMAKVTNLIIENKGGLAIVNKNFNKILKLPIAGLMSDKDLNHVFEDIQNLNKHINNLGCDMESPFMTLSFMALLVIPSLRLGDKGLFDVDSFNFIDLFEN